MAWRDNSARTDVTGAQLFEVRTDQCLSELRVLVLAPITFPVHQELLYNASDPDQLPMLALASYRWSANALVQFAQRLRGLLASYVHATPLASADLRSKGEEIRSVHMVAAALGRAMTDSVALIATAFRGKCLLSTGPQRRFCLELGPVLTEEWILTTGLLSQVSAGCSGLLNHLEFLAEHAADIELNRLGFRSQVAPVQRGITIGERRIAGLLREHDSLLARVAAVDRTRRSA